MTDYYEEVKEQSNQPKARVATPEPNPKTRMFEPVTDKNTLSKTRFTLVLGLALSFVILIGAAYAISALSGTSTATAVSQPWSATFTDVAVTVPATVGDAAGSCSGPPGLTFSCTGTSIVSSEHYVITATADNPNINPETTTLTYSDSGAGWSASCSINGGGPIATGGTGSLAVGSNSVVCIVTASSDTADTFSIGIS